MSALSDDCFSDVAGTAKNGGDLQRGERSKGRRAERSSRGSKRNGRGERENEREGASVGEPTARPPPLRNDLFIMAYLLRQLPHL